MNTIFSSSSRVRFRSSAYPSQIGLLRRNTDSARVCGGAVSLPQTYRAMYALAKSLDIRGRSKARPKAALADLLTTHLLKQNRA